MVADNMTVVRDATSRHVEMPGLTTEALVEVHAALLPNEPRRHGLRTVQNWIGGSDWHPIDADFVPPPPDEVRRLMGDLAAYVNGAAHSPIAQAALVHAQFETIHPFIDGNGRTGRALIHTVLRRADALRNALIPISTVFAGDTDSYIAGLTDYRADPPALDEWVIGFAQAAEKAAGNAVRLAEDIAALDRDVYDRLVAFRRDRGLNPAVPRRDAVVLRILGTLASDPVLTAESVSTRLAVSPAAAHRALTELAEAGILGRTKDQRGRLVCWTADRHLALVALTERSNRVGGGDTQGRKPRLGPALPDVSQFGARRQASTTRRDAPGL